jgi:hypothetical protein
MIRYLLAALASLSFILATPALADNIKVASPNVQVVAVTLDPATLTTNTAFALNIDTQFYPSLTCEVSVLGGASRLVIPKCYAESTFTTLTFTYPTMTVAAAAQGRYVFDPYLSAATADTGVTDSPNVPCRFLSITAAAAGDGTVSCTKRRF